MILALVVSVLTLILVAGGLLADRGYLDRLLEWLG